MRKKMASTAQPVEVRLAKKARRDFLTSCAGNVKCRRLLVNASQTLHLDLKPRGGAAVRLVEADAQMQKGIKRYKGEML